MSHLEKKLVAVMNKSIEPGKILNALAHMCVGFGASTGPDSLHLIDYIDADGNCHPNISKRPFIILRANGNKIRKLREQAIEASCSYSVFTDTMTIGTWDEQLERTKETKEENLVYYGIVIDGPADLVTEMTKKFSLWKGDE